MLSEEKIIKKYYVTDFGVKTDCPDLQTTAFQTALDMCKNQGGMVVVPKGKYNIAALRMWSNTTLYLESGAELYGSENCDDYEIFPIPDGVEMRSDMELITQYYSTPWETYRRAMITAYGEKNISIIGEPNSIIDGRNCYDPNGEEGYRGPHAIFLSCCENVLFEGYTARHSGNFLHEANHCKNLTMRRVTCLGGSDGIHMHCTEHAIVEDCLFKTGDDCIAGINIKDLKVRRCVLNTSCNVFRMGGVGIYVEDCYAYGPGYYPHRKTVVKGKNDELPRTDGRHNMQALLDYFASTNYPYDPSDIHFKNCVIEDLENVVYNPVGHDFLHSGTTLKELTFENVRITDLKRNSLVWNGEIPLTIRMKNSTFEFIEGVLLETPFHLDEGSTTKIIIE